MMEVVEILIICNNINKQRYKLMYNQYINTVYFLLGDLFEIIECRRFMGDCLFINLRKSIT